VPKKEDWEDAFNEEFTRGLLINRNRVIMFISRVIEQSFEEGYQECCENNGILHGEDAKRFIENIERVNKEREAMTPEEKEKELKDINTFLGILDDSKEVA